MGIADIFRRRTTVDALLERAGIDKNDLSYVVQDPFPSLERDPFPSPRTDTAEPREDGWQNPWMGYGTPRDKIVQGSHSSSLNLDDEELSSLFYFDDIAHKLIAKRPEEAFRKGYKLKDAANAELLVELQAKAKALNFDAKMQEAWQWGRCYGGALLIIGALDGNLATPLNERATLDVKFLTVVDKRTVSVQKLYENPLSPNYGEPELYNLAGKDSAPVLLHESRCIRFDGTSVDARKRRELGGWSYSVLQRPYDVMRQFATAFQAAAVLTSDASQAVFKIKGLMQQIASGQTRLAKRMQLVDMTRSALRAVLLDADGEEFTRIATQFQGLPEMLNAFAARLAAAFDMPVTILMGREPAGDNATGASDFKHWYDSIASDQVKNLTEKVQRFYRILSRGKLPNVEVCWLPLQEMTEAERADIDLKEATAEEKRVGAGILYPQEIALAKYGKGTNGQIVIDEEDRKRALEAEKELTLNPPPPVVPAGPVTKPGGFGADQPTE